MSEHLYKKLVRPLIAALVCASLAGAVTWASAPVRTARKTDAPAPAAMSLKDCIHTALAGNPGLKAAKNGAVAARESEGAVRSDYFPRLDFQTGYRRWESRAFLPNSIQSLPFGPISNVIGPTNQYDLKLEGSYTLFDSGRRKASVRRATAFARAASQGASQTGQDTIMGVYRAYYGLLAARANLSVAKESLKRSEAHLKLAESRKAVGAVPLADVLRARVGVANARLALVSARSAVEVARGDLNTAMGRPAETPLAIEDVKGEPVAPGPFSMDSAMKTAVAQRPDLQAAVSRESAGREAVKAAKSAYGPTVTAQAAYGRLDSTFFPTDRDWAVGIAVRIPVFTGFERGHELARAKAELAQVENRRVEAELGVRRQVWTAHADVEKAYNSVLAVKALNADARESLRMADERYKVGAGTITDLLDAETNLAEAQAAQVRSDFGYRVAKAELERALGELEVGG